MQKAIIFDCFGVLITDSVSALLDNYAYQDSVKKQKVWDSIKAGNVGMLSTKEVHAQIAEILGITIDDLHSSVTDSEAKNTILLDIIKNLRQKGIKTALLSNISAGGIAKRFSAEELQAHFDCVVESGALGFAKPDVQVYQYVCSELQVRPNDALMIDDREDYCAGAEQANLASFVYTDINSAIRAINLFIEK